MAFAGGLKRGKERGKEREREKDNNIRLVESEGEVYLGISLVAQASANGPHKTKKEKQCGVVCT